MTDGQWVFYFDAPAGSRILSSGFIGISTFDNNLWWSYEHKKWLPPAECGNEGASSSVPCRSFKAFKSHLRRHPELQTGETVTLASMFVGYDIHARWSKELKARPVGRFVLDGKVRGLSYKFVIMDDPHFYLPKMVGSEGL